jgi:hypothetical protein
MLPFFTAYILGHNSLFRNSMNNITVLGFYLTPTFLNWNIVTNNQSHMWNCEISFIDSFPVSLIVLFYIYIYSHYCNRNSANRVFTLIEVTVQPLVLCQTLIENVKPTFKSTSQYFKTYGLHKPTVGNRSNINSHKAIRGKAVMKVVQGWPGLYFFTKRIYLPESPDSQPSPLLPVLPSSDLQYVDEHCHAVGWSSLTVSPGLFFWITWCTSLWSKLL